MNENRLSMIALNRNNSHLFVKRFLATKYQMCFMQLSQPHDGRKKGVGLSCPYWQDQPDASFRSVGKQLPSSCPLPLDRLQLGLDLRDIELEHQVTVVDIAAASGRIPEKAACEKVVIG